MTLELHEPTGATPLTPDELLGLKAKHITSRGELNELEGENIIEGLTWLDRRRKSYDILTDDAAREVHKRLFGQVWDWAGIYRLTEKNIGVQVWHISTEIRTCLDDARYWRENGTYEPLEAIARFHHKLVWVHPFANGNGRWARIMADAYLATIDQDIFLDWSGSGTLTADSDHRTRYIAALRAADGFDFEPLIEFVGSLKAGGDIVR
ncbi:mobile mystery protein B [Ruegeria sp. HU-ET01832]|uniref:mobile mystery protein B n=1 Tax=Ruegeria sp. HU-ET01832 TaxID=3135906 RepID=UPI003105E90C